MDITNSIQEYKTKLESDLVLPTKSRPKIKRYPYPFRDIREFVISSHAKQRMEERGIATPDVAFIVKYGRALPQKRNGRVVIFIFLCPGELPKRKAEQKILARLWGTALVVRPDSPVVITVLSRWFLWSKLIYQKPPLA